MARHFLIKGTVFLTLIIFLWNACPIWAEVAQQDETQKAESVANATEPPSVSAQTALVMELTTGRILYEKGSDEKVYPASTTKIMTALLAIEDRDLEEMVKVPQRAVGVEGSSIYLTAGEEIPLKDLVYGLMLRSGNDAAVAIAETIGGSTEEFVEMMNERALELGAENTHFMNPNGLYDDNHYTTAYDMALMAREAMLNQAFKEVAGAKSWQADRGEGKYNTFYNKNKVVFQYDGGTGVKIGYTKASGRTLVASSERDGMEVICVVMNAPDWFNDSYHLMDYAYENYEMKPVAEGQRILKTTGLRRGDKKHVFIGPREDVVCPVKKEEPGVITIEYDVDENANAPVARWQEAGALKVYVDGEYVYDTPLYFLEDVFRRTVR